MSAGIAFLVRCRDEEATLERSLQSLETLTISHEIIIVLHRCTDRSADIAAAAADKNPNIRIFTYDTEISRAGYQTLATDAASAHSIMTYYKWCKAKTTKPWIFKWDADFIATPALIDYLNGQPWTPQPPHKIMIHAKDESGKNWEPYLSTGLASYGKYIFWEVPLWYPPVSEITLNPPIYIEHVSKLATMKSYWTASTPWYETEASEEATLVRSRMQRLQEEFGPEPQGMARASNPECDPPFIRIRDAKPAYINFYG